MPGPDVPTTSVPNPPWWANGQQAQQRKRKRQQVEKIKKAFRDDQVDVRLYPDDLDPEGMEFMYQPATLLTRTTDAGDVISALGPNSEATTNDDGRGLTTITLPNKPEFANLRDVVARVEAGTQRSPIVGLNHVVHLCGNSGSCPATEPVPATYNLPRPQRPNNPNPGGDGDGVKVAIVDTGRINEVVTKHSGWLAGVDGKEEKGSVGHYRGHGTFVAGVVRAMAPKATIKILPLLYRRGSILEGELVRELTAALDFEPDIISMSAGTTSFDVGEAVGFQVFFEALNSRFPGSVIVSAAGNDDCTEHFWPASFDWAVGVGALDSAGLRAGYSNYGDSADVFALGTDHVNAYPDRTYHYEEEPLTDKQAQFPAGMAYWSGTSFATPLVSGLIASQMTAGPRITARQAWETLYQKAKQDQGSLGRPRLFP